MVGNVREDSHWSSVMHDSHGSRAAADVPRVPSHDEFWEYHHQDDSDECVKFSLFTEIRIEIYLK